MTRMPGPKPEAEPVRLGEQGAGDEEIFTTQADGVTGRNLHSQLEFRGDDDGGVIAEQITEGLGGAKRKGSVERVKGGVDGLYRDHLRDVLFDGGRHGYGFRDAREDAILGADLLHSRNLFRRQVSPGLGLQIGGDELLGIAQEHATKSVAETFHSA